MQLGVAGCGLLELIADVVTSGTARQPSQARAVMVVSLRIVCIVAAKAASSVVRDMLLVRDECILVIDCSIALPFLRFCGSVDEPCAKRKQKTIALQQNATCRAICRFAQY